MSHVIHVLTKSDKEVIDSVKEAFEEAEFPPLGNIHIHISIQGTPAQCNLLEWENYSSVSKCVSSTDAAIEKIQFVGHVDGQERVAVIIDRGTYYDTLTPKIGNGPTIEQRAALVKALLARFERCSTRDSFEEIIGAAGKQDLIRAEAKSSHLHSALDRLGGVLVDFEKAQIRGLGERRKELEAEFDARKEKLEGALNEREAGLDEREKLIDTSDNTTARRKLRTDFKKEVGVAKGKISFVRAMMRSLLIHLLFISTIVSLGYLTFKLTADLQAGLGKLNNLELANFDSRNPFGDLDNTTELGSTDKILATYASAIDSQTSVVYLVGVKSGLSTIACLLMVIYYIKWFDSSLKRYEREELRLERALVDIDRSSWLVEIGLEWKKVYPEDPIPKDILERLSRGLFDESEISATAIHPTEEAIAALLGSAKAININTPNGSVTMDQKAVSKARKQI